VQKVENMGNGIRCKVNFRSLNFEVYYFPYWPYYLKILKLLVINNLICDGTL